MRENMVQDVLLDESLDPFESYPVQVPKWARYCSMFLPSLTENSNISFKVMLHSAATAATLLPTNNTGWSPLYDAAEALVTIATGVENCWIDLSNYIKALPGDCWLRVTFATEQETADLTMRVCFRGA